MAELLTVLAILTVLAGLLFPVFLSARATAKQSSCLSNMRQVQTATWLYVSDYDEYFMPVNHRPAQDPNAKLDRTWVQMVLPYARSFSIFNCPSDYSIREKAETTFDQDLVPGDIYSQYYTASMHVNTGYNYLNLSPIVFHQGRWSAEPKMFTMVESPSKTLLFVDTVWSRNRQGQPIGGGNWIVVPPCRYFGSGSTRVDSFKTDGFVYTPYVGWKLSQKNSPEVYGNAWPWHTDKVNVAKVDGSAKAYKVEQLTTGCNMQDSWRGSIRDPGDYIWDTN